MGTHPDEDDGSRSTCESSFGAGACKNRWRRANEGMTRETSTNSLKLLDPLLHLFSHCLVCAHERLFVDHDFGRIGFRSTDSGGDCRGVGLDNDAINGNETGSCRI